MRFRIHIAAVSILVSLLIPSLLVAQEVPRKLYSAPVGLTQVDALRVVVAPAPLRFQGPANLCQAQVTVEVLDAMNMSILATEGPTLVSVGASFQADFTVQVGAPPERREIVVRVTVDRTPGRTSEEDTLAEACPLLGSAQLFDAVTGRTTAFVNVDRMGIPGINT